MEKWVSSKAISLFIDGNVSILRWQKKSVMLFARVWHFHTLTTHPKVGKSIWKEACVLTEIWFWLPFSGKDRCQYRIQLKYKQQDTQQAYQECSSPNHCLLAFLMLSKESEYHQFFCFVSISCQMTLNGVQYSFEITHKLVIIHFPRICLFVYSYT